MIRLGLRTQNPKCFEIFLVETPIPPQQPVRTISSVGPDEEIRKDPIPPSPGLAVGPSRSSCEKGHRFESVTTIDDTDLINPGQRQAEYLRAQSQTMDTI